jgi:flagellar assembly protein FliH
MSSSVLKGEAALALPRVEWKNLGATPPGPMKTRAVTAAGAAAQPAPAADPALIERQAYERGLRDGEAAGARKSLEQLQAAIHGFARSAAELAGYKSRLRQEVQSQLVALSMAVARKILKRELSVDPAVVTAVVRGCLEELEQVEIYRVRASPEDVPVLAAFFQQQRWPNIEIVPDGRIGRGGALLETAQGQIDARLESQLEEIARGLADK